MASLKILIMVLQYLLYGRWNGGVEKQAAANCWNETAPGGWQEVETLWKEQRLTLRQDLKRNKVS